MEDTLRTALTRKTVEPHCPTCGAKSDTWRYQIRLLPSFETVDVAPERERYEVDQAAVRNYLHGRRN
ncbi:MAG: hypothetical protein PHC88_05410 [Terrimicrobiaceae bacterium]|nr:hypothetical protein [Terrimicrobiaceae bacterium]